ncbi:MAG TPA: hypothetical protein PKA82_18215 [Pyrinomonadaceae bacterium]|nr:hypothetical protein [Pyrinomonadaceae bacterium]
MNIRTTALTISVIALFAMSVSAQRTEVALTVNEQFFDALLDATFKHFDPPQFSIAMTDSSTDVDSGWLSKSGPSFGENETCSSAITVLREFNGTRTSVRFREGRPQVQLAFSGARQAPLIGCIEFDGVADAVVDVQYDQQNKRLTGNVQITNVNVNGTGGYGGTVIARLVQGSIERKFNPVEILSLDKVSFGLPIPNAGRLQMNAVGVRTEMTGGAMVVRIEYEFVKG